MLITYLILKSIHNNQNPFELTGRRKLVYSQIAEALQGLERTGSVIRVGISFQLTDIGIHRLKELRPKRYKIYPRAQDRLEKNKIHDMFIPKTGWNR